MKKFALIIAVAVACAVLAVAQNSVDLTTPATEINLGDFPVGTWHDDTWNADWEFSSRNIRLLQNGALVYNFSGKVKNFKVNAGTAGVTISFDCDETKRSYQFNKGISLSTDITMTIDRHDTPASAPNTHYVKTMKKK
ncbi:MAG: hypothetical protein J6I73_08915 [Treponema sp.]|nr:hypothetical protein [Treponema sp.]